MKGIVADLEATEAEVHEGGQVHEPDWSNLDRTRRRRPEWVRRGIVFAAIHREGGVVDEHRYEDIVVAAGYADPRSVNRFFVGEPEPVLQRRGSLISLTSRGISAARFFWSYWLPRLRDGRVAWPTASA